MTTQIKPCFLLYTFTLFVCLNYFFLSNAVAQNEDQPVGVPPANYTFETIEVPGVDFLAVTASSDFEDYAGYTKSADGEKEVAFTLIDGVFTTYDFPDSQKTHFYALGNDGRAAGHYQDSDGLHHGVILENGELRLYDFPDAVETQILGISDATGVLTGNFIDASGMRRGFTGETIIEYPGASETYADFVNASGAVVGSYVDKVDGTYHPYVRNPNGTFTSVKIPGAYFLEYFFVHGINDVGAYIVRNKRLRDVPRTYVGTLFQGLEGFQFSSDQELFAELVVSTLHELQFPGSVSTEGWNINQDGSVVGNYVSADGRRHGFFARPTPKEKSGGSTTAAQDPAASASDNYTFETIDVPGVEFLAVTASSDFEDYAGYTKSADGKKNVGFTLIDGVFATYDFPGSQNTYFYALGNNGNAAGHYQDSNGLYHGVILENSELRQYDFPVAVETFIYSISDATGALTGAFTDASGVHRGFSGDTIIEYPGATETYASFTSDSIVVGTYVDADGVFHPYIRTPTGQFVSLNLPKAASLEYFFVHDANEAAVVVSRAKPVDSGPLTYVGTFQDGLEEFKVPGSVITQGYNINQDGSIVGYYDSPDGRRHGFIARPITETTAQVDDQPVPTPSEFYYTFETIDVPGVDFLELTASSDFEDYAGNTKSTDGEKTVGFTLIDGVFMTYDFPGSLNTYFYALGNDGQAAGHYEDSDGLYHGVILENGELRQYDFPDAVQTEIYGISDATGALTGNFIDAAGVRRGFSGDEIIEYPGATETYADFVSGLGNIVGSYVDAEGLYYPYLRSTAGRFISLDLPQAATFEYYFVHGINDVGVIVGRSKRIGGVPRTSVGLLHYGLQELQFPGSVSTEGWNINQDGSVVGNYVSADGRRHGFIARPADKAESDHFSNVYTTALSKGLNMLSVPLAPPKPMTAKSLVAMTGATTIITLDTASQRFVAWTPSAPDDGFPIEGGKGYIVNVPEARNFAFVGGAWRNRPEAAAAPPVISVDEGNEQEAWAFVVSGRVGEPNPYEGKPAFDGYEVIVHNLRTENTITASVRGDYFAAATADLTRRSVVRVDDVIELRVIGPNGNVESQTLSFKVTPEDLANAVLSVRLDGIGQPTQNLLLQNYPNPFNPETWIPYQLSEDSAVSISIYDTAGRLVRRLSLGFQSAGFYNSRYRAAYWDGRNENGESVASGVYFLQLQAGDYTDFRRMAILK